MNIGSLPSARLMSGILGPPANKNKPEGSSTKGLGITITDQTDLSPAANLHKTTLSLNANKSENIKAMMEALSKIQERTESLRQFGDNLTKIRHSNLNIVKLGESLEVIGHQLEYVTRILEQEGKKSESEDKNSEKNMNNHIPFLKSLKDRLDSYQPNPSKGFEAFTRDAKDLMDSLKDIEAFLKHEIQQRYNSLAGSLDQSMGVLSNFSPNQAKEMAIMAAEQLLKGFDIILGIGDTRQSVRVVKLLRDESNTIFKGV